MWASSSFGRAVSKVGSRLAESASAPGLRRLLEKQGLKGAQLRARSILVVDWDLTVANTTTPAVIRNRLTGAPLLHPKTRAPLVVGVGPTRNADAELAELRAAFPTLAWNHAAPDFKHAFEGTQKFLESEPIQATLEKMRQANRDPNTRVFVLTARTNGDKLIPDMLAYLREQGVTADAVLAPNSKAARWHVPALNLPGMDMGRRKATMIDALAEVTGAQELRFIDDNATQNLAAAMERLPARHPNIRQTFTQVIHGEDGFFHQEIAVSPEGAKTLIGEPGTERISDMVQLAARAQRPFDVDPIFAAQFSAAA